MHASLARAGVGQDKNFITATTVTTWLERLVRAAAQKSRAFGEIARRYQNFNRPDLARRVLERAYVATYLESALISRLMLDITAQSASAQLPQLRLTLENTQRNYRMALLDMRETYRQITDEVNYFGYPPDYIPFPALDVSSVATLANAYEMLQVTAKQRTDLAKQREQIALTFGKQGKVDAAQFQSDLTSLKNNYENQLASLCGTFTADDGRAYPAIRKYAPLATIPTLLADPCGRLGNGDLANAITNSQDAMLKLRGAITRHSNLLKEITIERGRAAEQCGLAQSLADFVFDQQGKAADLQQKIDEQRAIVGLITGTMNAASQGLQAMANGPTGIGAGISVIALGTAAAGTQFASDFLIAGKERELKDFDRDTMRMQTLQTCKVGNVDSRAKIANLYNDTLETQIEIMRAELSMRLAVADVQKIANNAQRLQAQQEEAEQLAIDVQAAQNDPNVRIYQNDSVINADISFNAALAAAYRLTRVFEYYTSQSYAKKEQLFLIRMVTAGQYNLENYLLELDNEFLAFEDQFGNPDLRVMVLSLRDDILKIPYHSTPDGGQPSQPYSENERISMLRAALRDPARLDGNGYLTIPFSTDLKAVSPLTRNHKVHHVEVDLQGVKMGDPVARVYLRMSGTGVVRDLSDQLDYYVFPPRLGVINASLLGAKVYDPSVYQNFRFRDRPLVNTMWELVVNQRDEQVNQDIDLQTLTDMRVLIYYTDFTAF
jgi:hypothetical protein